MNHFDLSAYSQNWSIYKERIHFLLYNYRKTTKHVIIKIFLS